MNGRFKSHSWGGSGPQSGLLLSRTPVYIIVGVPSVFAMQQPAQTHTLSGLPPTPGLIMRMTPPPPRAQLTYAICSRLGRGMHHMSTIMPLRMNGGGQALKCNIRDNGLEARRTRSS